MRQTTAVLNGKILSTTGGPGTWFVEYGLGPDRGQKEPTRSFFFEAGESVPVSEPVEGLEPGTTYYFAVCAEDAENPGEPFCSPNQTFTTDSDTTFTFTTDESVFEGSSRNRGWWSPTSPNYDVNSNILTGRFGDAYHRSFFSFDVSSACRAAAVTLQVERGAQTGPLTYSLFDVSTPAEALNQNEGTSQTIFDDLGSGTTFGSFPVDPGAETEILSFPLNSDGVAAYNAARAGFLSIGGRSSGENSSEDSYLFGESGLTTTLEPTLLEVGCDPDP